MKYILAVILFVASVCDWKYHKIPNWLFCIGLLIGFISPFSMCSYAEKIISFILLFFVGMLRLMGMGDIKLWTVIAVFIGLKNSLYVLGIAAVLLIFHQLLANGKETMSILIFSLKDILLKKKIEFFEQKGYPFAPYIFASYILLTILGKVI